MNPLWTHALIESLQTAPLLVGNLPEACQFDRAHLGRADRAISLNVKQKLGHLYESALEHLLQNSPQFDLVTSSLQIVDASGRTLGEMDYLLRDEESSEMIHLELAVKFYLAHSAPSGWTYPGPDPKDDWYGKLQRMREHQLRMAQTEVAQRILRQRFAVESVQVRQLIYGRLFLPFGGDHCPFPEWLAPNALLGRWLYVQQRSELLPSLGEVSLLPKALWPVQVTPELLATLQKVTVAELEQRAEERCVMFILPHSLEPLFLVPNHWPRSEL